jgi:hypothetical protein
MDSEEDRKDLWTSSDATSDNKQDESNTNSDKSDEEAAIGTLMKWILTKKEIKGYV